jgi:hypothetical protein
MCVPLIDRWLKCMDDGNLIGTIFLDLEKAFALLVLQVHD